MSLLRTIQYTHPPSCPCHSNPDHHHHHRYNGPTPYARKTKRGYATPQQQPPLKEYAFEMAASAIRFGNGVTREIGMDLKNMGAKNVAVVTDGTVDKLRAMEQVRAALGEENINYQVFNRTRVEPKDSSYVLPFYCPLQSTVKQSLTISQHPGRHCVGQADQPRCLCGRRWWFCHGHGQAHEPVHLLPGR